MSNLIEPFITASYPPLISGMEGNRLSDSIGPRFFRGDASVYTRFPGISRPASVNLWSTRKSIARCPVVVFLRWIANRHRHLLNAELATCTTTRPRTILRPVWHQGQHGPDRLCYKITAPRKITLDDVDWRWFPERERAGGKVWRPPPEMREAMRLGRARG